MHKKLMSLLLAVTLLATCLTALPVMAAGDALTDITSGGQWAKTGLTNAEVLSNKVAFDASATTYAYDKTSQTALIKVDNGNTRGQYIDLTKMNIAAAESGTIELSMTIKPEAYNDENPNFFKDASGENTFFSIYFEMYVDNAAVAIANDKYRGLEVINKNKAAAANGEAVTVAFPVRDQNVVKYTEGMSIPVKYTITKNGEELSAQMSAYINNAWVDGGTNLATTATGTLTGIGFRLGSSGRANGEVIAYRCSDAALTDVAMEAAQFPDLSENYYPNGNELVPVDFVLPKGYTAAAIEVEGTEVATLDSASYPAGAYTAKLDLSKISGKGHLELTFGGALGDGSNFTKTTTLNRAIDENWVAPTKIPAKVTFTTADGGELTALTAGTSVKATADTSVTNPLVILGLYQDGILKAVKSGNGSATLTVPTEIDATKATLKAFMLNSYDDANTLVRAGQWNSSDATLADLLIAGKSLEGFSNTQDTYDVTLPASIISWPTITPVANDSATSAAVSQSGAFPGTTTVDLTAEDGTSKTITLNWSQTAATVSNIKSTSEKTNFATVTLAEPEFKEEPGDLDMTATSDNAERNPLYAESNIKNAIEVYPDRANNYWIAYVPDAFVGATMLQMPYDSSQWSHATNNSTNKKFITFDLDRSATVYVSGGRGFDANGKATWMADGGWKKTTEDIPVVMSNSDKAGNYAYAYTARETYKKHYDVAEWGDKVQVEIGSIVWSANLIWVVFD